MDNNFLKKKSDDYVISHYPIPTKFNDKNNAHKWFYYLLNNKFGRFYLENKHGSHIMDKWGCFGNKLVFHKFSNQSIPISNNSDEEQLSKESSMVQNIFFTSLWFKFEEVFFIAHALGAFLYENKTIKEMSEFLWNSFCEYDINFPITYAVYHYYRSRCWVVKCGLKFGCDFLLYKESIESYHSSYCVHIVDVTSRNESHQILSNPSINRTCKNWEEFFLINRIANQVNKEVILCIVEIIPCIDGQYNDIQSYLQSIKITELFVQRFTCL